MPGPDLNGPTKVEAKFHSLTAGTNSTGVLTCPTGAVLRIVALTADNIDGTNAADITLEVGSTKLRSTIAVPADSSLILVDRNYPLYVTENVELKCQASAAGDIQINVSYEEIT
jgi:hypothetical protein